MPLIALLLPAYILQAEVKFTPFDTLVTDKHEPIPEIVYSVLAIGLF
jgi:hypothetical protein